MASLNRAMIMGNLGKDPELKYTQSGVAVCGFSVAVHEAWRDKEGAKQESVEWVNVTVWNKQAENCAKYLKKGSSVYLEGNIKTDCYEKNGEKRYSTKIVARDVKFLNSKAEHSQGQANARQYQGARQAGKPADIATNNLEDIPF